MNLSSCRYPVEATASGLIQHGRQKTYMFSILWSDQNDILIYRTYEEFKELAKQLKKKFPLEAGLINKTERILPILKDAPLIFRTSRFSNRYIERLHLLESYSQALLRTDPKVSQCEEVTQFFSPSKQDLSPSFDKNSLVIIPSEKDQRSKKMSHRMKYEHTITQPMVSQSYVCVETFETKDTKNKPFKVNKNECVDVLIKDTTGWWLVENEEKQLAWFPGPFLVKTEAEEEVGMNRNPLRDDTKYYAMKGYEAQSDDELSLRVGVIVDVIEKSDIGWWRICYNGRSGYVPSMFLKPYSNPHQTLKVTFDQDRFGSTPNLTKAVSSLALNELSTKNDHVTSKTENNKTNLNRRKSRSLGGFSNITDPSVLDSIILKQKRSSRESSVTWESPSKENDQMMALFKDIEKTKPGLASEDSGPRLMGMTQYQQFSETMNRKDSGFDETQSPGGSIPPDSSSNKGLPRVPPRPTSQEIHSRCTTITKKAALL